MLERSLYYNAFKLLNEATKEGKGSRIVVFIDDLDRCLLDKALFVLEYMKLVLAQPGFIFFLGLDDRIIEGYLDKRFREDYKVTNFSGREYLRKLVQLSFRIPPHHGRIHDFATTCVSRIAASLSDAEKKELEDITPIFGAACKANPRAVIRYLNNLLVDCAIARTNKELAKIPIGMFAVTRALQENWLEVFDLVQKLEKGSELLPHLKAKPGKADTEQAPREDSLVARILAQVEAEEDLKKLLNSEPGHKYLENDDQRQACVEYLVRTRQAEMEITEVQVVKDKRVVMGYVIEPHANLKGADLRRANLEGANLRMADLQRADLEGAILGVANLWGASLRGASLRRADLEGAILEGANLDAADLDGANLDGAYFWGADIRGASLKATSLKGTNLKGTNLRGAVLPASIEDIKKIVKWDENTIWPDGSRG